MKKLLFLFLTASTLLFTGCVDMIEELFLNKDGSGKYTLTFDMSSLFSDPMMKGMFKEALKENEDLDLSGAESMEMDTLITFTNMPEEKKATLDNPDFWKKVSMRTMMSESKGKMFTTIELNFENINDINYLYEHLSELGEEGNPMGGMMGGNGILPSGGLFDLNKGTLTRRPANAPDEAAEEDENLAMMKMMFSTASYKTIYHLPGKVKKTSIPNADIDGKTITVTSSLLELMDGKAKLDGDIKFKKR